MWSVVEKTALAEAEVEYHDHKSHTIWVPFKIVSGAADDMADARVVIWTTTPWTIPQNRAICFSETISYGLYRVNATPDECWCSVGDLYLLADNLAADTFAKARLEDGAWEKVRAVPAEELAKTDLRPPPPRRRRR